MDCNVNTDGLYSGMLRWLQEKAGVVGKRPDKIILTLPPDMLVFTRSDRERIDALVDGENRVRRMVVHTKSDG